MTDTAFVLTTCGHCEFIGCRAPLYVELAQCGDPDCPHNRVCFECFQLIEDVAEEMLQEELNDLIDDVVRQHHRSRSGGRMPPPERGCHGAAA